MAQAQTHAGAATYYRLYVWEMPVRIFHWLDAVCVFLLIGTGWLIGSPHVIVRSAEAYQQYWFGTVRLVHFVSAYVLLFNFLMRIYWGFVGNHYARWREFFPFSKHQRDEIRDVLRVDILQTRDDIEFQSGHNALAAFSYLIFFVVLAVQIATGFALYASMSDAWLPQLFAWVVPFMGGDMPARFWHHVTMWFFVVFTMIHVYLVFYHDYVEGRGTTSSIFGGWKFSRTERFTDIHHPAADARAAAARAAAMPAAGKDVNE